MENIYVKLREEALRDNQITPEEAELLDSILPDLDRYVEALEEALADGLISEEEQRTLQEFREKVWENAVETALRDSIINSDEDALLVTLAHILSQLS